MRSRVVSLYDYHKVDLSDFRIHFVPDEETIQREFYFLLQKAAKWVDSDVIEEYSTSVLASKSEYPKYNKKKLRLSVGSGLFDADYEKQLLGMKAGETRIITTEKGTAEATLLETKSRDLPLLTDEVVREYGPEDVNTISEYRAKLIEEQKNQKLDDVAYFADRKIYGEMFKNSEFVIAQEDFEYVMNIQLNRFEEIAKAEGMDLKTMTPEQFEGRVPVRSYDGLRVLMYEDSWEYLQNYLAAVHTLDADQIDISEETYEKSVQEYASFWRESMEVSRKINTYEEFKLSQYKIKFYEGVSKFRNQELLRED